MVNTETKISELKMMECPLCHAPLSNPKACDKCDWRMEETPELLNPRDKIAAILSIIPGLGHVYKGHFIMGALWFAGMFLAVSVFSVVATFTAGFGLLLLPIYWLAAMTHAYWVPDFKLYPHVAH